MSEEAPLQIGYRDVYNNFLPLVDLSYFICSVSSQTDEEADIKYLESIRMKK
jgi:hypothetical protein